MTNCRFYTGLKIFPLYFMFFMVLITLLFTERLACAGTDEELEVVIVTARKIPENINMVPGQVSVFMEREMEERRIRGVEDVVREVPSLYFPDAHTALVAPIFMRGLGSYGWGEHSVGFFVDGVYMGADSQIRQGLFDIDHIEVLQGPQTIMYGKSTIGGAINVVTRKPSGENNGMVSILRGSGDRTRLTGAVGGGFKEGGTSGYRLALDKEWFGGYEHNSDGRSVDQDNSGSIRLTLYGESDGVEVTPSITLNRRNSAGYDYRLTNSPTNYVGQPFNRNDPTLTQVQNYQASLRLEGNQNAVQWTSLTALNRSEELSFLDGDWDPTPAIYGEKDYVREDWSQEFRLSSKAPWGAWRSGLYYFHQHQDYQQWIWLGGRQTAPFTGHTDIGADTFSLFGQVDIKLAKPFSLDIGLRTDWDWRQLDGPGISPKNEEFFFLTPEIGLSYDITPRDRVRISYTMGHKAGGFNHVTGIPFDSEKSHQYELGIKSHPSDAITLNGAVFLTRLNNQQLAYIDPVANVEATGNMGQSEILGMEMSGFWKVTPEWRVESGVTALHNRFLNYTTNRLGPNGLRQYALNGNRPPYVPDYRFNIALHHQQELTSYKGKPVTGFARINVEAMGRLYWSDFNDASQEPYQVVGATTGIERGPLSARFFVGNLTDEKYFSLYVPSYLYPLPSGSDLGIRGPGRHFGLELSSKF